MKKTPRPMIFMGLIFLLALCFSGVGCDCKSSAQWEQDLLSSDKEKLAKAAEALAKDPVFVAKAASALSSREKPARDRYFRVIMAAKENAAGNMLDNVRYVRLSQDHKKQFIQYFSSLGNSGAQLLLDRYSLLANNVAAGFDRKDFGATTMVYFDRADDIATIMMAIDVPDNSSLSLQLTHPFPGIRELTSKVLCSKGFAPKATGSDGRIDPGTFVYYAQTAALSGCGDSAGALDSLAKMALIDFEGFLALERKYPSPAGLKFEVLARLGTPQAVAYLENQAQDTDNPFVFIQLIKALEKIDSEQARQAKSRLLKRKDMPELFEGFEIH